MVSNSIFKVKSKACLNTVRSKLILLPGATTVQKRFSWFSIIPGFIKPVILYLVHMSQKPQWTQNDALFALKFDEIHLTKMPNYDSKNQCLIGPHKDCQVMLICGLISQWEFPLFFHFDFAVDVKTLKQAISLLYDINFINMWVVCDQGPKNRALINANNLNITIQKPFFEHPGNPNLKVHFSFDSIHIFKSLGSHVRDDYCQLPSNHIFTIKDFDKAIEDRGISETGLGKHLHKKQTKAVGQARQDVGFVRQMFSPETADLIESQNPNDERLKAVAKFCRDISDGIQAKCSSLLTAL